MASINASNLSHSETLHLLIERGTQAGDQQCFEAAIECFQAAAQLRPQEATIHAKLGYLYLQANQFDASLVASEEAIRLRAGLVPAHLNLADCLTAMNRVEEAMQACRAALHYDPHSVPAHYSLACNLLRTGQFEAGWQEYDWRLQLSESVMPIMTQLRWDGAGFKGKTLLILIEQGLGDTLQFVRYIPLVKALGGHVLFQCQRLLVPLLQSLTGADQIIPCGEGVPPFDIYIPIMSLPHVMKTRMDTIPATPQGLTVDQSKISEWESRMQNISRLKVGLCWQGNPKHTFDAQRSIPLQQLLHGVGTDEVQYISLQTGIGAEQVETLDESCDIIHHGELLSNFEDTAACMMNCDLVVSVDSAMGHLAGALGRTVWLLLHTPGDWRWFQASDSTPWYPSMRLFRQETPFDWSPVLHRLKKALREEAAV